MKIDSAIKTFVEKYDREAMASIDRISKEYGLVVQESKIKAFNMKESFDQFDKWLKGYASYQIEAVNNTEKQLTHEAIAESCDKFISGNDMFAETQITYDKLPKFVQAYIEGVNTILATIDEVQTAMMEADVDSTIIGNMNEYVDKFMTRLDESFSPTMDRILWASGYNSAKALAERVAGKSQHKAVFL